VFNEAGGSIPPWHGTDQWTAPATGATESAEFLP
jgi:hypothetical protein